MDRVIKKHPAIKTTTLLVSVGRNTLWHLLPMLRLHSRTIAAVKFLTRSVQGHCVYDLILCMFKYTCAQDVAFT